MMKFYASKFPIRTKGYPGSDDEELLSVGTIFKVLAISGCMIDLWYPAFYEWRDGLWWK